MVYESISIYTKGYLNSLSSFPIIHDFVISIHFLNNETQSTIVRKAQGQMVYESISIYTKRYLNSLAL